MKKRFLAMFLALVMCLALLPTAALAADETGSLTITKAVEGDIPGSVYADMLFSFTVTGPNGSTTASVKAGKTVTINDLPVGEYTVSEDTDAAQIDGYSLMIGTEPDPVEVTSAGAAVTVTNTYSALEIPDDPTPTSDILSVKAVWVGDAAADRPASIDVQVFKDGMLSETVTLSAANGWKWSKVIDEEEMKSVWQVDAGEVPAGYTSEIVKSNMTWTITNTYSVTPDPDPAPGDSDPASGVSDPSKPDKNDPPDLGKAGIQDTTIRKGATAKDWVERLELPEYAEKLYDVISGARDKSRPGIFEYERNFILPKPSAAPEVSEITRIEVAEFDLYDLYAAPGAELGKEIFTKESFYSVSPDAEDRKVDCAKLAMGDVAATANFNGVYVTKIPYDDGFDARKKEACEYIAAVYHAFDRDNPEIFWLSGKCKARIMVAADPATGAKTAYFFLVLADKDGFDMRAPAWTGAGAITAGIARRDAAVAAILQTVTATDAAGRVKQLNKWLTEHNQYNTTPDLTTIGNEPHECLAALEGRIGTDGPVCDGYSRAFKVLCDKLGVPCVLETGWAKAKADGAPGFHMWSLAQVGGTWYGCDVTWDDPSVKGIVAAKSGRENENYLLVGSGTARNGLTFSQSHAVKNQAAVGGVDFNNGPSMGLTAYSGIDEQPSFPAVESIPDTGTAVARTQSVLLDGKPLELRCYAILDGGGLTNYVRLRDLTYALDGAGVRFGVKWDGAAQRVVIVSDTAYTPDGSENAAPFTGDRPYKKDANPVSFDGTDALLTAFRLFDDQGGGYTYYKLRDLGQLLNFNVGWDGSSVFIETDKPYNPNN